jgi:hypothetical protein
MTLHLLFGVMINEDLGDDAIGGKVIEKLGLVLG